MRLTLDFNRPLLAASWICDIFGGPERMSLSSRAKFIRKVLPYGTILFLTTFFLHRETEHVLWQSRFRTLAHSDCRSVFIANHNTDPLDDGRDWAAVVLELLRAVMHGHTCLSANIFIIGAFIGILEPPPSADIVNKDVGERCLAVLNILDHPRQGVASLDIQAALAFIRILSDDLHSTTLGVFADNVHLVAGRVLLMLRGHSDVSSGENGPGFCVASKHAD